MAKLLLMLGSSVLKTIDIDKEVITIGRKPGNDIKIDNLAVSGFHAKIIKEEGQYLVEDLNSTNGTFVGRKRVSHGALKNNDVITVGKHSLKFLSEEPEVAEADDVTVRAKTQPLEETMVISSRQRRRPSETSKDVRVAAAGGNGVLTVISGSTDKQEYELTEKLITIGKANSAGIRIKGFFAPSVAALINRVREDYYINSPGTGKKPMLNGKPVQTRQALRDGDILEIAGVKMQFSIREE